MTEENVNRSNSEMNIDLNETETNQMAKENVNRSSSEKNFDLNQQVTLGNISDLEVPKRLQNCKIWEALHLLIIP